MQIVCYSNSCVQTVNYRHESQIFNFNGVHMNDNLSNQNCLTRYRWNPSKSRTGPEGQNIPGQRDLLMSEKAIL